MLTSEAIIKIVNVVATAALKHGIDLNAVVNAFPEADYRPERFPGIIFRLKKPKTATLIFGSGKMVCTGARSEKEARGALMKLVRTLRDGGIIIAGNPEVKIVNLVASVDLGGLVDLEELYASERGMGGRIIYEPGQFPGLIYRMENPKASFLIFSTGKVVCAGTRKKEEVYRAVNMLHKRLEEKKLIRYE